MRRHLPWLRHFFSLNSVQDQGTHLPTDFLFLTLLNATCASRLLFHSLFPAQSSNSSDWFCIFWNENLWMFLYTWPLICFKVLFWGSYLLNIETLWLIYLSTKIWFLLKCILIEEVKEKLKVLWKFKHSKIILLGTGNLIYSSQFLNGTVENLHNL